MPATVTTTKLNREIALEERLVGIPTSRPLTDGAIARRRWQIALVLAASGFAALFATLFATGRVQAGAIGIAAVFALYAIEKDRHLRRLALLRGDSKRISLAVASELMFSGALVADREALDLRDVIAQSAGKLAAGFADVVAADCTRLRVLGPSGEVPVAAERELSARQLVPDDAGAAHEVLRSHKSVRRVTDDARGVIVVALQRGGEILALLEAVTPSGEQFRAGDVAVAEAYARGVVAALAPRVGSRPLASTLVGDLDGQVAIITGGASGIGHATAVRFSAEGATVVVFDRDLDAAELAAQAVGGEAYTVDVRDGDAVTAAVTAVAERHGRVDVLFNNAGSGDLRPLHSVDDKLWHRLIDVNLTGTFNGIRAVVPLMLAAGRGAIVNNASVSGITPTRNEAAYSAAKAGVIALTKSGALEYGPYVRVNCVAPGHVRTPLTVAFEQFPDLFDPVQRAIPLGRIGQAEEIAEVVLFLASGRSSYITGQTLVVDGGISLPQAGTDVALAQLLERFSGT